MSTTGEAFRANAPLALGDSWNPSLSAAMDEVVARGAAAWPELAVEPAAVVAQAARALPRTLAAGALADTIASLHAADLHLACGCALGSAAALSAFDRRFLAAGVLRAALARIDTAPAFADEVSQMLREKLLLARPGAPPRIAEYSGRRPLSSWVRAIAVHAAVDLRRSGGAANAPSADERAADQLVGGESPELQYLQLRYGPILREALSASFALLDDEQANLLRLQLVDGLRTPQIAALFGVARSTVNRRLTSCRELLLAESQKRLREKLHLSPSEFESLAGLLRGELYLSLGRLLKRS